MIVIFLARNIFLSFALSRYEYGYKFLNSTSSCLRQSCSEHSAPAAYFFISTLLELG
ncbi:hypothetical protein CAMGR0001_1894 [Campylobacter gracilis RM3268]|uniref:Uncharacterized protein n=1 Tax=Campylobacter gracilis RM3268 TaxID=553220 RepID=C8PEJ3_9BACT|nr:hypothetical protein CAMGR0001_1894 [Campylobacter gracilis RM3268]